MAQEESTEKNDNAEIRNKLIARLAVAGGLVAVLLGILAFFDYLASAPDESEAPVFSQPVPVAPKKEVSKPVLPADNPPEPPPPEKAEPIEPAKAEVPPPPVVEAKPEVMPEKPAAAAPVGKTPAAAVPARPTKPVPEVTTAPETAPATKLPAPAAVQPSEAKEAAVPVKPSARVAETKSTQPVQPVQPVQPPNPLRLFSGFVLQAGVFTNIQRAEEIHAKLTLSGVPSTLETRVQVGPFRTRQEAEAAQAKLKELGVESILVPPKGGR